METVERDLDMTGLPWIDGVLAIGGLIVPPVFDFIKKKFVKPENDTPERTISSLAVSKPEVIPEYVKALASHLQAKTGWFNRDVVGTPSQVIIDLRAGIRPIGVIIAFALLFADATPGITLAEGARYSCEVVISSWFGSRLTSR